MTRFLWIGGAAVPVHRAKEGTCIPPWAKGLPVAVAGPAGPIVNGQVEGVIGRIRSDVIALLILGGVV